MTPATPFPVRIITDDIDVVDDEEDIPKMAKVEAAMISFIFSLELSLSLKLSLRRLQFSLYSSFCV